MIQKQNHRRQFLKLGLLGLTSYLASNLPTLSRVPAGRDYLQSRSSELLTRSGLSHKLISAQLNRYRKLHHSLISMAGKTLSPQQISLSKYLETELSLYQRYFDQLRSPHTLKLDEGTWTEIERVALHNDYQEGWLLVSGPAPKLHILALDHEGLNLDTQNLIAAIDLSEQAYYLDFGRNKKAHISHLIDRFRYP